MSAPPRLVSHQPSPLSFPRFIRIDGSTPPAERQRLVNTFQENADVKIAILSIKAAGVGLTMTVRGCCVRGQFEWVLKKEGPTRCVPSTRPLPPHTTQAASTVVFAEMTWTPGEIIQAEGACRVSGV